MTSSSPSNSSATAISGTWPKPTAACPAAPITHAAEAVDEARYQTVYAREPGAVAAPHGRTALRRRPVCAPARTRGGTAFLTLHVGAGTFQPVRVERIADHRMHSERFDIPAATAQAIAATGQPAAA